MAIFVGIEISICVKNEHMKSYHYGNKNSFSDMFAV